jgi:hypothetical protein
MKEAGTAHWTSPNTGATNESGFTGLPGGKLKKISASDFQFIYLQNNGVRLNLIQIVLGFAN